MHPLPKRKLDRQHITPHKEKEKEAGQCKYNNKQHSNSRGMNRARINHTPQDTRPKRWWGWKGNWTKEPNTTPPLQKKGHQNKNKKIENRTDARCKVTIKALDSHPFFCFPLPPPSPFFFSPGQPTTPPITPPPARRLTRPWRSRRCSRVQRAACPTAARVPSAQTAGAPPCLSHRPTASPA